MKRIVCLVVAVLCLTVCFAGCGKPQPHGDSNDTDMENFNFSLVWGTNGQSSYDSRTGKLVKTKNATHPQDYVTEYKLSAEEKARIYELMRELDVTSYPDTYDPNEGWESSPPMTLILTVRGTWYKKISAANICMTYGSDDPKGQRFLSTCREIVDILTETEEWKALPDYEFFYK